MKCRAISRNHGRTAYDPVEPIMRHCDRPPNRLEPDAQGIP
jgi:hypothetical protein